MLTPPYCSQNSPTASVSFMYVQGKPGMQTMSYYPALYLINCFTPFNCTYIVIPSDHMIFTGTGEKFPYLLLLSPLLWSIQTKSEMKHNASISKFREYAHPIMKLIIP